MNLTDAEARQLFYILQYIEDYASRGDLPNQGEPDDDSVTDAVITFTDDLLQTHFPKPVPKKPKEPFRVERSEHDTHKKFTLSS